MNPGAIPRATIAAGALALAVAAGVYWLTRPPSTVIDPGDREAVARGAVVYAENCAQCHGADLEGEPNWQVRGPDGMLPAPPHDSTGHTWHHTDEHLFAVVKHGIARFAPPEYKTRMPAFVGTLPDGDIRAVLAYIKSRWPEDVRRRQPRS